MQMQTQRWVILTALLLLNSCGTITIPNFQHCSPLPGLVGRGAVCDNFLTSQQEIKDEQDWEELQGEWVSTQCISSQTLGQLKVLVEEACSKIKCNEETKIQVVSGLQKMMNTSPVPLK